jgi:hypothetical protein
MFKAAGNPKHLNLISDHYNLSSAVGKCDEEKALRENNIQISSIQKLVPVFK